MNGGRKAFRQKKISTGHCPSHISHIGFVFNYQPPRRSLSRDSGDARKFVGAGFAAGLIFKFTNVRGPVRGEPEETFVRGRSEFRDPPVKVDRLSDDDAHLCNVLSCPQVPRVSPRRNLFDLFCLKSIISPAYILDDADDLRRIYENNRDERSETQRYCSRAIFLFSFRSTPLSLSLSLYLHLYGA